MELEEEQRNNVYGTRAEIAQKQCVYGTKTTMVHKLCLWNQNNYSTDIMCMELEQLWYTNYVYGTRTSTVQK